MTIPIVFYFRLISVAGALVPRSGYVKKFRQFEDWPFGRSLFKRNAFQMRIFFFITFFSFLFIFSPTAGFADTQAICANKNYYLKNADGIKFSKNELLLICGGNTPGWRNIPTRQALYQIRAFLRQQGYYRPVVDMGSTTDDRIVIDPGPQTHIEGVTFKGAPEGFGDISYLGVKDKTLNSDHLSELSTWSESRLRALGYPCPQVQVAASFETGKVRVDLTPGKRLRISEIKREGAENLAAEVPTRFDAIGAGDWFNGDYLSLSSRRMMASRLAGYAYSSPSCLGNADQSVVQQKISLNKPRYLGFAFGASTEEFPLFKAEWMHSQLDNMASSLRAELYLSSLRQSLAAEWRKFPTTRLPRLYLAPKFEVINATEDVYETFTQKYGAALGYIYDFDHSQLVVESSPVYNIEDSFEGQAPRHSEFLALESLLSLTSHYYEYFQASPRTGYQVQMRWQSQKDADRYDFSGTYLINLGRFDPPITVLGLRFQQSILQAQGLAIAPQSYRLYLGGDNNVRGFSRNAVNNGDQGYQTTSYVGFESRFTDLLPYQLHPFLFYDVARVGIDGFQWTSTILSSPGVGLRWQSPIGVFRVTVGQGRITRRAATESYLDEDWTFFLSFGKEF